MEHLKTEYHGRPIVLRDAAVSDVDALVAYWWGDSAYIASLGTDMSRLRDRETLRASLAASFESPARTGAFWVAECEGCAIAYVALQFLTPEAAQAHVHVLHRTLRNKALVYFMFPKVLRLFFARFPLRRVHMQTWSANRGIARLLEHFGLRSRRANLLSPAGLGRPGEFDIYEIERDSLADLPH
jgi:RimJ/RimL family protein N-acetyltransferase